MALLSTAPCSPPTAAAAARWRPRVTLKCLAPAPRCEAKPAQPARFGCSPLAPALRRAGTSLPLARGSPRRRAAPVASGAAPATPPTGGPATFNPLRFSARNELFVGRLAGLGLVCALIGERLTGKGALAQLNVETGLPVWELEPAFLILVGILATSAVIPFEDAFQGANEPAAPMLGVRFTADRQRRLGRLAMLSFAAALVAEAVTGQGPLDLLELDTGVPMDELEAGLIFFTLILGFGDAGADKDETQAAAAPGAVDGPTFGDEQSLPDEEDFDWDGEDDDDDD